MKTCNTCGEAKPPGAFAADRRNRDGLQGRCRTCANARQKVRQIEKPALRERANERARRYKRTEAGKAAARRNYLRYTEAHKERVRRWVEANPAQRNRNSRAYVARHPERRQATSRAAAARRRALIGVAVVTVTAEQIAARIAYWGDRCWVCGGEWEQVDHVKPVSKGGAHLAANLRPICADCNRRKAAKWPFERSAA